MGELFSYSLLSAITLALCWLPYRLWMSGRKQFALNRFCVCLIFILSLVSPFIVFNTGGASPASADFNILPAMPTSELAVGEGSAPKGIGIWPFVVLLFAVGVTCSALNYLWSLVRIRLILRRSRKESIDSTKIRVTHDTSLSPFSCGNKIIISDAMFRSESLSVVLTHERAHIRHLHWLDLILAQVVVIIQWYNPVAWWLHKELKEIHEYQADEDVVGSGVDELAYQKFLVAVSFSPKFNLPADFLSAGTIRKRIMMMNQRKPSGLKRLIAIAVVPAFALGVMACNQAPVKHFVRQLQSASLSEILSFNYGGDDEISQDADLRNLDNQRVLNGDTESQRSSISEEDRFTEAAYPGGTPELMMFLMANLKYPEEAERNNEQGQVIIAFELTADGDVKSIKVDKSVSKSLDAEALRVSSLIRKFTPATLNGTPVESTYRLPINFKTK